MTVLKRSIYYFETPGFLNTNSVIEAVKERLKLGDLKVVVVPITTGRTAKAFSSKIMREAEIITVSEDEALSVCKRFADSNQGLSESLVRNRLEGVLKIDKILRREVFDITFLPFCGETWNAITEMLYTFGQGMKVAIQIAVAAVEVLKVKPYTRIISVGGTGEGADTAIVVRTSSQSEAFGKRPEKRLSIQEIIAMPIKKW